MSQGRRLAISAAIFAAAGMDDDADNEIDAMLGTDHETAWVGVCELAALSARLAHRVAAAEGIDAVSAIAHEVTTTTGGRL